MHTSCGLRALSSLFLSPSHLSDVGLVLSPSPTRARTPPLPRHYHKLPPSAQSTIINPPLPLPLLPLPPTPFPSRLCLKQRWARLGAPSRLALERFLFATDLVSRLF